MTRRPTPRHPTRERRLYGAAARGYVAAMRDLFLFPMVTRRELRYLIRPPFNRDTLADLAILPAAFGPDGVPPNVENRPIANASPPTSRWPVRTWSQNLSVLKPSTR